MKLRKTVLLPTLVIFLFIAKTATADIYNIDLKKVGYPATLQPYIDFMQQHLGMYDHWVHDWKYDIKKDVVVDKLTVIYNSIDNLSAKNTEAYLLMGDVAHFLYNIEIEEFYKKAIENYSKAIPLSPDDYRGYWFLGNHYSASAVPDKAIENYDIALKKIPQNVTWSFWADYGFAAFMAGMPSTAAYAVEKMHQAGGETPNMKFLAGEIKKSMRSFNADTSIEAKEVWYNKGYDGERSIIVNKPLGIKMLADSNWAVHIYNLENKGSAITFTLSAPDKKINRDVTYSILVLARAAKPGESLQDFYNNFAVPNTSLKNYVITDKYKNALSFELTDPNTYKNIGGAHYYNIAIAADEPAHPGVLLEQVHKFPPGKGLTYYKLMPEFNRLKGKLYYYILLDSCEDVNKESLAQFTRFVNDLLIE